MLPLLSFKDAANIDKAIIERLNLDERKLVFNAANGAYEILREKLLGKRVLFLIGPGNNGSDGLALALLLKEENNNIEIFYYSEKGRRLNLHLRQECSDIRSSAFLDLSQADVIIDALFGFSARSELDSRLSSVFEKVKRSGIPVYALDTPSLMKIKAEETVTFTTNKFPFYLPDNRVLDGNIHLYNPGFPEIKDSPGNIYLLENTDYSRLPLSITDFKNKRGHLAVVGGSERFKGAPILTSMAAFHASAGLVTLYTKDSVIIKALQEEPSIIVSHEEKFHAQEYDAFVLGPGWDDGSEDILDSVIQAKKNFVLDADAIKLLKGRKLGYKGIITPHIGEYKRIMSNLGMDDGLFNEEKLYSALKKLSEKIEATIILKSSTIWITGESGKLYIYDGVNPSLGVAGSGDVLSGILGAFLLSEENMEKAAINAVIVHQEAGIRSHDKYSFYSSNDLIKEIRV